MTGAPMDDNWIRRLNTLQLIVAGVIIMAPVVWMALSSFKPSFEVTAYPPTLLFSPTTENYAQLFKSTPFFSYGVNSLIVTLGSAGLGLLFGIPAAFAVRVLHHAASQISGYTNRDASKIDRSFNEGLRNPRSER